MKPCYQLNHKMSVLIILLFVSSKAWALTIDLNTFLASPVENITILADGTSATFTENSVFSPVALENHTFDIPTDALSLSFDYELIVAQGNEDYFGFYFNNLSAPLFDVGGVATTDSLVWNDTFEMDLTSFAGTTAAMIFDFSFGFDDFGLGSVLTISNLVIDQQLMKVSEPGLLSLLLLGLAAMGVCVRKSYKDHCITG